LRILITGSNGQLGRELQKQMNNTDKYILMPTDVDEMDICNINEIRQVFVSFNPDIIINCAAYTAVDACEDNIEIATKINTMGPKNLATVSREFDKKIIQISTDYVFDGQKPTPYIEEDKTCPQSVYGKTKADAEEFVRSINPKHFIVRTAWLYGDGKNFVKTMLGLSKSQDKLKVVNDQVGSPTSTYALVKGILKLIDSDKYGIYHATCSGSCSWYEFAVEIFNIKNIDIEVNPCTSDEFVQKAKRPSNSILTNNNFKKRLNFVFPDWKIEIKKYLKELNL